MSIGIRLFRLLVGIVVLAVALVAGFSILQPQMPHWGATPVEAAQALPGDGELPVPQVDWTNARTIKAQPEQVWPWLTQIGDIRGAFYSFTFIEDRVGKLIGAADYTVNYTNANTIHPEWQNPQPGDVIIQGILQWERIEPGRWLLATSTDPKAMGWTWVWHIAPTADGQGTRLVNRIRIQAPGPANPIVNFFIGNGAFIMEQRMMDGIKAHAEGWVEPPYQETVEIILWAVALLAGLAGAILFIARRPWIAPLTLAVASVGVILVLTFVQPPIAVRVLLDAALLVGIWISARVAPASRPR
jgi:hypothetical protein